jgi:hypothetical protein
MKVEEDKFDAALSKLLKAKPVPKKSVKTSGKRGSKKANHYAAFLLPSRELLIGENFSVRVAFAHINMSKTSLFKQVTENVPSVPSSRISGLKTPWRQPGNHLRG